MLLPFLTQGVVEAGCDEAGRGCLAGPVFAAAVILPTASALASCGAIDVASGIGATGEPLPAELLEGLNDSKKLSDKQRYRLRPLIEQYAVAYAVARVEASEIDRINILQASIAAMHRAVDGLVVRPEALLIDGNRFRPYPGVPHSCQIKGDGRFLSIAAASILAKTYRDDYMIALSEQHPAYCWAINKGYPTKAHREAIRLYGVTPHHRQSFKLLPDPDSVA